MIDLVACVLFLRPDAVFSSSGLEYSGITWRDPRPMPTEAECIAAWPSVQAQIAADAQAASTASTNRLTLEDQALAALAANKVFYSRTSSTTAQVLAQVKAHARQNNGVIRLLLKRLDAAD